MIGFLDACQCKIRLQDIVYIDTRTFSVILLWFHGHGVYLVIILTNQNPSAPPSGGGGYYGQPPAYGHHQPPPQHSGYHNPPPPHGGGYHQPPPPAGMNQYPPPHGTYPPPPGGGYPAPYPQQGQAPPPAGPPPGVDPTLWSWFMVSNVVVKNVSLRCYCLLCGLFRIGNIFQLCEIESMYLNTCYF